MKPTTTRTILVTVTIEGDIPDIGGHIEKRIWSLEIKEGHGAPGAPIASGRVINVEARDVKAIEMVPKSQVVASPPTKLTTTKWIDVGYQGREVINHVDPLDITAKDRKRIDEYTPLARASVVDTGYLQLDGDGEAIDLAQPRTSGYMRVLPEGNGHDKKPPQLVNMLALERIVEEEMQAENPRKTIDHYES